MLFFAMQIALPGERAIDGDGTVRPDLESAYRLVRPRGISATRACTRGGEVVCPLAELRHQCCEGAKKVLSTTVLPLQHGLAGAFQLGAHVFGLQQPELQEGRARLRPDRPRSAPRRDSTASHPYQSLQ